MAVIIDFHAHIFPSEVVAERDAYLRRDPSFAELYSSPKAKLATAEDLIASMDEAGIDVSVAVNFGWSTHELCVETNDYIMESVARYSGRLVGFGMVQPRAGEDALREAERCATGGLRGLGELRPCSQDFRLDNAATMEPLVDIAREKGFIFLLHASEPVGHVYAGKGCTTPDVVFRFLSNFPDIAVVCAHWGGGLPFYALMPEVEKLMRGVYFDTAATSLLYRAQIFDVVASLVGADRILFGTDFPCLKQRNQLRQVKYLGLHPDAEAQILGENAQRLLGLAGHGGQAC